MKYELKTDPLNDPILKGMIRFAIPVSVSFLMTMLFSFADTVVIGRFGHENAISAIGVSASVLNFLVSGITALSTGVLVTAGRYYGEQKIDEVRQLLHHIPAIALLPGTALAAVSILTSNLLLQLLNCPALIFQDALLYLRIYCLGIPLVTLTSFFAAILEAKGNSFLPFLFQIAASIVNVCLNLLFVIVFDWNVAGVAAATVISELVPVILLGAWFLRQNDELKLDLRHLRGPHGTKPVFEIGMPSSLEGIILNLSGVIIASFINRFDTAVIAGNTIGTQLEGLMVVTFTGFAGASTVFISQNFGAGNHLRVKQIFRTTMITVFLAAELSGILLYLCAPVLAGIFTTDVQIISCAVSRMFYMCLFFGLCGTMNVVSGCIRGLGDAKSPLYISIFGSVIFRLTWVFTYGVAKNTPEAVYMSFPICWFLCTALNILAFQRLAKTKLTIGL